MAYTTLSDVKNYLGVTDTADDSLLSVFMNVAQQAIDGHCDRTFEAVADSTRYFDCAHPTVIGRTLYLDKDLCQVTRVINGDGVEIPSSEYVTVPQDGPCYALRLLSNSDKVWTYGTYPERAIAVTGRWAYSTTAPAPVMHVVNVIVGWLYRSYDRQGERKSNGQGVNGELPVEAARLLGPYRRYM